MIISAQPPLRPDAALVEEVRRALNRSRNSWLKRIDVSVSEEVVFLKGNVPTFHFKQLALATVMAVAGVVLVRNELVVGSDEG
jgi:osmotically-inducible protein OsmY